MKPLIHKKLEWLSPLKEPMSLDDANEFCNKLGDGWRLPTANELDLIVSYNQKNPTLEHKITKKFNTNDTSFYWLSNTYISCSSVVWDVYLASGIVGKGVKIRDGYVWPVRDIKKG